MFTSASEPHIIDLNFIKTKPKLPFIHLPSLNMKILLDSGASNSIINPKAAKSFPNFSYQKPFIVHGLGKRIFSTHNICIPLLSELGIPDWIHFHVINWHNHFDALLGSEDLIHLGAKINYENNTLEIGETHIPFLLEYTSVNTTVNPTVINNLIKIPVTIENGDVIFPELQLTDDITIPESLITASNGYCTFLLDNQIDESEIHMTERIKVTPLIDEEIQDPPTRINQLNTHEMIRTQHLNAEEKTEIIKLCRTFKDVFYNENCDLTFTNAVKHEIRTKDEEPVYVRSFRHPQSMKEEIRNQIQKLLDNKIIRPSISPYSAPVWIVPKKLDASGKRKFRMVIDYRKLNEKTIEDKYPLPRIEEILDNLGKCCYFTTLDLAQGFHQIELHPNSIEKTAFSVENGHYEYVRMPFGLKNAPSTFQRVMDNVLREYLHRFCFVYMDDVVIFSKSLKEHLDHLRLIFSKFRHYNLKIQLDKSEFLCKDVAFLGHVITPEGIKPNPSKIEVIEKYPIPKTQKEIKSFLGLIGYYRRFISNFAKIVAPITKCLKKNSKVNHQDEEYIQSFELCKELLMNAPILAYPDFAKPFKLTTDASMVAIGSVLSQSGRPIAYYSRTLNSAERNYSTIERELLAILDSTKHFRPYLFGNRFIIETDHNPLVWLYKIKEPNSRLVRWKLKLEEFDFDIQYKKGKENKVADALSRIEINANETEDLDVISITPNVDEVPEITDEDIQQIINSQSLDSLEDLQIDALEDLEEMLNGNKEQENTDATVHSVSNEDDGKIIPISEQAVNNFPNRIILKTNEAYKCRYTKPFNKNTYKIDLRKEFINEDLTTIFKEVIKPNSTYGIYFTEENIKKPFITLCQQLLNNQVKLFISNTFCRDVLKSEEQADIVTQYHNETHNGISETYNHLRKQYYWPNMKTTMTNIINQCDECLQTKYERHPYHLKFQGPLVAKRPFDVIHIDTFSFQNSKFLTLIDLFSKYAQAYHIKDSTAITILNKLRHYLAHHNYPRKIVCDEGREFSNNTFREFCKLHKIELHFTTVNNPSSNSPIERFHSTIIEKLRVIKLKNPNEQPSNLMITAVTIYNQSIHSSTGFSPFHLLYGPYDKVLSIDPDATIYEQYNNKRKEEILPFFDTVYRKTLEKAQNTLNKRNANCENPPNLENQKVFVERNRPRKVDPPFEPITVTEQHQTKIQGKTKKGRTTTANITTIKRLRNIPSLQVDPVGDEPQPGPSSKPD